MILSSVQFYHIMSLDYIAKQKEIGKIIIDYNARKKSYNYIPVSF